MSSRGESAAVEGARDRITGRGFVALLGRKANWSGPVTLTDWPLPWPFRDASVLPASFVGPHLVVAIIIITAASAALLPVLLNGFPNGPDIQHHYRWSLQFSQALRQGYLYPRWFADANNGYGSPAAIYYPPLSFYVSAVCNVLTRDILNSISLACWLAAVLSGFTMYRFSRDLLPVRWSLLASILYMWAPYHMFDLYRGNSIAEYWCFVWIPLILHSVYKIASAEDRSNVPALAISYALLLLTDVPVSLMVSLSVPVFFFLLARKRGALGRLLGGLTLGLAMSAIFTSSVLLERGYIKSGGLLVKSYQQTFLFERLLAVLRINPFSRADYRGHEGYLLEAEAAAVCLLLIWALGSAIIFRRGAFESRERLKLILAILAMSGLGLLMTSRASSLIWRMVPQLEYLQVANRWLLMATIGMCILTAVAFSRLTSNVKKRPLALVLLATAVLLNLVISIHMTTQRVVDRSSIPTWLGREGVPQEFFPAKWWNGRWDKDLEDSDYAVSSGDFTIDQVSGHGLNRTYATRASVESDIRLKPLYFPGWTAWIDGKEAPVRPGIGGHIQLSVPAGQHEIELRFGDTWVRWFGKVISALSLLIWLGLLFWAKRTKLPTGEAAL
jgi:hypothetical protein